jgi:hypothetical protein
MLFALLKTIRRAFETQPGILWAISEDIAIFLYSYASRVTPINMEDSHLHINVCIRNTLEASMLDAVIEELKKQGFVQVSSTKEHLTLQYSLSPTTIIISYSKKPLEVIWMRNRKGKATYPLLEPNDLMRKKKAEIEKMGMMEKAVEWEKYDWMKEVINYIVIE